MTAPVSALRERVYATLVGLSTVVLLLSYAAETSAGEAVTDIGAAMGALCLAGGFADVSAHRITHGRFPCGDDLRHIVAAAGHVLETALLPVLSVGAAALGWLPLKTALWLAALSLVLTIAALALLATRRTAVRWPVKLLLFVVELAIALAVVGVKLLAH
ncbi:hypothetical protein SAMN04489727_3949 [Amycolatopsis tolypomycina]|uniref:Uncharacterized protein n=1 Tax=Amycolatopsis tolypomycina TaxID=208445 RepID=A0A1H4SYB6_9PSEU|nr:hypothetical protein [Amycolatopsis tolypomycina]SEC49185.1 hypothetical protein SAMN04489727_3949 [Amycolatopsis tolypomycina]